LPQFEAAPRYWTSEGKAEVDFLIQHKNEIIPVEVKSDKNIRSKSLALFHQQFKPALRIRYSLRNLSFVDGLLNIPLFLADHTRKFIESSSPEFRNCRPGSPFQSSPVCPPVFGAFY